MIAVRLGAIVLALIVSEIAWGQPGNTPREPAPAPNHQTQPPSVASRLILSGAVGLGTQQDWLAASLTVGFRQHPKLAWVAGGIGAGEYCWGTSGCDPEVNGLAVLGGGAQWWPHDRIWIRGLIGAAYMNSLTYADEGPGLGWSASAGFEVLSFPLAAIDARASLLGGFFDELGPTRAVFTLGITLR